ncbi:hypothetical protein P167DRAFT_532758 [Morchella conica CCBAS932]|uniref:Uncharacterized protein n=1 Tax=Morchella conica CCBAS932 TaxID=1392247 RepID=A0A3N4KZ52_9PEZI|nr:hypothetical protein P167DRAFT_532758 [Morchella conica CCBAS932]
MAQAIGQQLNLGPQPNFNNLVQHVNAAMDEVFRIPNLPLAGQGDVIVQLLQGIQRDIQQVQRDIQQVQRDIQQVQRDVRHIRAEQDLLPIKLYNSGAREREHFRYPQGVAIAYPPLPRSRDELAHMTIVECQAAAAHLGLQPLPQNTLVGDRRRQIAEYLV